MTTDLYPYSIEPQEGIEEGCRCCSCWYYTGKWVVTKDLPDVEFEKVFSSEEEALSWVRSQLGISCDTP